MKKALLVLMVGLFGINNLAQAQFVAKTYDQNTATSQPMKAPTAEGDVIFKYCNDNITNSIGVNNPSTKLSAAISLPKSKFAYAGKTIRAVKVGLGEDCENFSIFIRSTLEGENLYYQHVGNVSSGWNTIYLETPYTVPDADFYMGISCTGGSFPIGFSGTRVQEACWLQIENEAWESYYNKNWGSLCYQIIMNEEEHTFTDVSLLSLSVKGMKTDEPIIVQGRIKNASTHAVNSAGITYTINSENAKSQTIEESLVVGASKNFSFEIDPITKGGEYTIEVKVVSINGIEVTNPSTLSASFSLYETFVQRKVLLEYFTTMSCGNCPAAQENWKKTLSTRENVIWVSHHAGYYTDTYTIAESSSYTWFYNAGGNTYAPAAMLDRTNLKDYGAANSSGATPGPIFGIGNTTYLGTLTDVELDKPAFVLIDLSKDYTEDTKELKIAVEVDKIEGMTLGANPTINIFLTENNISGTQAGATGTYIHNNVIRKVLTTTWGEAITFDENGSFSKEYSITLNASWKPEDMQIVAFVSNYNNKNVNDCNVYNAENYPVISIAVESISVDEETAEINVGETLRLNYTILPSNATNKNVTWKSSNESIAKVSTTGLITGVAEGEATITATTKDGGFSDFCVVTVKSGTAIDNITKGNLLENVYTNANTIYMDITANGNVNIELFDISGKRVASAQKTINGKATTTLSTFGMKGVYILKVTASDGTTTRKIIL